MLLWAVVPSNPYGYYTILRVVVFTYTSFLAYRHLSTQPNRAAGWIAVALAITYNPLISLHLGRPLWTVVNLVTIALLLLAIPAANKHT
jgi:hypothetical protein